MPLYPGWSDIAVRLALPMLAGSIIGFNRGARGHAAGFQTTILVGLAASVAMIQTNIRLSMEGKTSGSFAVMDLMRLPLGILTGVGFYRRRRHSQEGRPRHRRHDGGDTVACDRHWALFGWRPVGAWCRYHAFGGDKALAAKMGGYRHPPATSRCPTIL